MSRKIRKLAIEGFAILLSIVIFWVPFYFVILTSFKTPKDAALMNLDWPGKFQILENYKAVLTAEKGLVIRAFFNSTVITVLSIAVMILVCSMAGFVMQRRASRASSLINFLVLAGLMIPPSVVPTIWVLMRIGLFKTLPGLILVEVALGFPFSAILYKGFLATIPREIDESAVVDGCGTARMFFSADFSSFEAGHLHHHRPFGREHFQ